MDQYKLREADLLKPEQIIYKVKYSVDTANSNAAVVSGDGVITVQTGKSCYQPVFARERIFSGQICKI